MSRWPVDQCPLLIDGTAYLIVAMGNQQQKEKSLKSEKKKRWLLQVVGAVFKR